MGKNRKREVGEGRNGEKQEKGVWGEEWGKNLM